MSLIDFIISLNFVTMCMLSLGEVPGKIHVPFKEVPDLSEIDMRYPDELDIQALKFERNMPGFLIQQR